MRKRIARLPGDEHLQSLLKAGLDRREIATRYGARMETVAARLARAGLLDAERELAKSKGDTLLVDRDRHLSEIGIHILPDRIVYTRESSLGLSGMKIVHSTSVPKISMHVATLQAEGRFA